MTQYIHTYIQYIFSITSVTVCGKNRGSATGGTGGRVLPIFESAGDNPPPIFRKIVDQIR